jgi:preprotein translocase subunit SecG
MVHTIILFAHLAVASLIIVLVLLQRGKGAEAGTGFGAGASGTVFGSRGTANFFSRTTAILATLFFATSLALAFIATQESGSQNILEDSLLQDRADQSREPRVAPAEPGAEGGQPQPAIDAPPELPEIGESERPAAEEAELPAIDEGEN